MDLAGPKYYGLSDRVKVMLLERLHGSTAPEELPEPPLDAEQFSHASDLQFATVRARNGRQYYVNPYYVAAWSNAIQERVASANATDFTVVVRTTS